MKFIILTTASQDIRSKVVNWVREDTKLIVPGESIDLVPDAQDIPLYKSVFEAMGDKFKLLGPPVSSGIDVIWDGENDPIEEDLFCWYLTKE